MKTLLVTLLAVLYLAGCAQINGMMGKDDGSSSADTSPPPAARSETPKQAPKQVTAAESTSYTRARESESAKGIYRNPPAGSPFSKIKVGMSAKQVTDLIGQPTDQKAYVTGKAWIPFYYGGDRSRMEYRYKGQGIITFAGSGGFSSAYTVSRVIYNPKEAGYEH